MNKKIIFIVIVIIAAAITTTVFFVQKNNKPEQNNKQSGSVLDVFSIAQARELPESGTCATNNSEVKTTAESQPSLGEDSGIYTGQIYDVPAGTNVDVNISSYNPDTTVGGSLLYSEGYGSYNFTLTKQGGVWRYTAFTRCTK